jgi:protein HOOK3
MKLSQLEKEKYKIQFEAAKAEQDSLIEKNIELKKMAQEHQHLKDEIDILKHTSDKVEKLESAIESYKIKLEEMTDLKKQMKQLEENNTKYLEKILIMEDEVKKITTLKSQIEMYKKQIQELHEQILNNEMQMKKLEYEYKSVQEKCMDLGNDKDRLQLEYDRLKESYETMSINAHAIENTKQSNFGSQQKFLDYILLTFDSLPVKI